MATQTNTTQTPKNSSRQAYQFACTGEDGMSSDCGYLLRNHDLKQVVDFSQRHVKDSHQIDAPASYFEGAAKKVAF